MKAKTGSDRFAVAAVEPVNIAGLREFLALDGQGALRFVGKDDLAALIDAVEAARPMYDVIANADDSPLYPNEARFRKAMSRFDFTDGDCEAVAPKGSVLPRED